MQRCEQTNMQHNIGLMAESLLPGNEHYHEDVACAGKPAVVSGQLEPVLPEVCALQAVAVPNHPGLSAQQHAESSAVRYCAYAVCEQLDVAPAALVWLGWMPSQSADTESVCIGVMPQERT